MTEISRSALFGRLNPTALKAIETATGFCKMRGNPYVELVHWLHILLQDAQNVQVLAGAPWLLMAAVPVIFVILAFNFLGDGLRDAADPYG